MYDVLVIGGGIHGAGVAQAAAVNGHSVLLLEKSSIGSGTSSKSSKLIHGGLRYLESGQLTLVRECLQERGHLLENAPHLVKLQPFIIPVYADTSRSAIKIRAGLSLYSVLNGLKKSSQFKSIPKSQWQNLDGLKTDNLKNVFQYWDAQTDDRLLTRAVIASAQRYDAEIETEASFVSANHEDKIWQVNYQCKGRGKSAAAKVIINAAGPWVNHVLDAVQPQPKKLNVDLVQGTHIVLQQKFDQGIYYLEAPADQRAVFVMPWYDASLVGTTEKIYRGDPENVSAGDDEIGYLLQTVQHYFPDKINIEAEVVSQSFAGLRVLPAADGAAFARPRETIIHEDKHNAPGVFSIYGGKLTAYRATAENVLSDCQQYLPVTKKRADTRKLALPVI